jgi:hypothetical protein
MNPLTRWSRYSNDGARMERRRRGRSARPSDKADQWSVITDATLLLAGVIRGIDIRDPPGPHAI